MLVCQWAETAFIMNIVFLSLWGVFGQSQMASKPRPTKPDYADQQKISKSPRVQLSQDEIANFLI